MRNLRNPLPVSSLLILFKSFVKFHVCGDIIYDYSYKNLFQNKVGNIQYSVSLDIPGAIGGTSKENFTKKKIDVLPTMKSFSFHKRALLFRAAVQKKFIFVGKSYIASQNILYVLFILYFCFEMELSVPGPFENFNLFLSVP